MTSSIWQSRKFWLTILDIAVSLATFFGGKYMTEASSAELIFVIGVLQPVFLMLIDTYTRQNVAGIQAAAVVAAAQVTPAEPCAEPSAK
jgi:hypothetical protein